MVEPSLGSLCFVRLFLSFSGTSLFSTKPINIHVTSFQVVLFDFSPSFFFVKEYLVSFKTTPIQTIPPFRLRHKPGSVPSFRSSVRPTTCRYTNYWLCNPIQSNNEIMTERMNQKKCKIKTQNKLKVDRRTDRPYWLFQPLPKLASYQPL